MSDIAIKVENLSKYYKLGVINSGTLSRDLQSWLWKKMGKEDPNKKIGYTESDAEGFWALKNINFEIKKGDRVGIIGRNGAGKSTLLKMISQISSPTTGKIYIDGKIASLLEVGTGFNPELTGRENIYLNGAILGMKKKEVDNKIDEIIAFSEIDKHIDTPVKRYSSGMYVRLAFAVAAHLDSDVLIADEVLAVGDIAFQKKALGKMNELSTGEGRTVMFVSHNMAQIKNLCNRGIVLEKGAVVRRDDIDNAINWYLNSDNINLLSDGSVSLDELHDANIKEKAFSSLVILNNKNKPQYEFLINDEMNVKVNLKQLSTYKDVAYCIAILDSFGRWVTSFATWMTNTVVTEQTKILKLKIPKLNFGAGIYHLYLSCTFYSAGIYIDRITSAVTFTIIPSDFQGTGRTFTIDDGVIIPNGELQIE